MWPKLAAQLTETETETALELESLLIILASVEVTTGNYRVDSR
jgi:hypothetical protein